MKKFWKWTREYPFFALIFIAWGLRLIFNLNYTQLFGVICLMNGVMFFIINMWIWFTGNFEE